MTKVYNFFNNYFTNFIFIYDIYNNLENPKVTFKVFGFETDSNAVAMSGLQINVQPRLNLSSCQFTCINLSSALVHAPRWCSYRQSILLFFIFPCFDWHLWQQCDVIFLSFLAKVCKEIFFFLIEKKTGPPFRAFDQSVFVEILWGFWKKKNARTLNICMLLHSLTRKGEFEDCESLRTESRVVEQCLLYMTGLLNSWTHSIKKINILTQNMRRLLSPHNYHRRFLKTVRDFVSEFVCLFEGKTCSKLTTRPEVYFYHIIQLLGHLLNWQRRRHKMRSRWEDGVGCESHGRRWDKYIYYILCGICKAFMKIFIE